MTYVDEEGEMIDWRNRISSLYSRKDSFSKTLEEELDKQRSKDEEAEKTNLNGLVLSDKLREKMKPLKSVTPQNVISALSQYDPEKAKMLDSVMAIVDDSLDLGVKGQYLGRIKIGKGGRLLGGRVLFDAHGEYHLVHLDPDLLDSGEPLDLLEEPLYVLDERRDLLTPKEPPFPQLNLAGILIHEIFGHAYDSKDGDADISVDYEGMFYDDKNELANAHSGLEDLLEGEFRAYYEEYRFLDWNIQTYSPLYADWRKSDHGDHDHRNQEDLSVYILYEFPLYAEYEKGRDTHDWTEFKRKIAASHIMTQESLSPVREYCYNKYRYKLERDRSKDVRTINRPLNRPLSSFMDGLINACEKREVMGEAVKLCLKQDLRHPISPQNPNKKIRNSNRKK